MELRGVLFRSSAVSPLKAESRKLMTDIDQLSSQIMHEIVLPAIEKEVNEGKHFAPLRQIYHSLLLAKWYKQMIKDTAFSKAYVDQNKVTGIDMADTTVTNQIYNLYVDAYKKGAYTFIQEDYDALSEESIPRKYFTGGIKDGGSMAMLSGKNLDPMEFKPAGQFFEAPVRVDVTGHSNRAMVSFTIDKNMLSKSDIDGLLEIVPNFVKILQQKNNPLKSYPALKERLLVLLKRCLELFNSN